MDSSQEKSAFREPTLFERQLLKRLLDLTNAGDDLTREVASRRVRTIVEHGDNYGSIELDAPVDRRDAGLHVLADALASDIDGVPIEAVLFSCRGRVVELEILKLDGSPIVRMPRPSEFNLFL